MNMFMNKTNYISMNQSEYEKQHQKLQNKQDKAIELIFKNKELRKL